MIFTYDFVLKDTVISEEDFVAYFDVIKGAFEVYLDREAIRHGLWKEYAAKDQLNQVKIKTDRVFRTLEHPNPTPEMIDNALKEIPDIINYSIFTAEKLSGRT